MKFVCLALCALGGIAPATAAPPDTQTAAVELNWTPLRLPTGERTALLGGHYLLELDEHWRVGPGAYGAAQGNHGGVFTVGFMAQRRWPLNPQTELAASLFVGAGGGLSSAELRFGGGLMLRPELSLRWRLGPAAYAGLGWSQTRFTNGRGNVRDGSLGLVLGHTSDFISHAPSAPAPTVPAAGMGFDEIALSAAQYAPAASALTRGGLAPQKLGTAGAWLRRYGSAGSWWGLEAAGAATGKADGYMEILVGLGQDYALSPSLRLGWQLGAGLGGGGDLHTGNGWLLKAGPTLRWLSPWGPTLHVDAAQVQAPDGRFKARQLRLALGLPLDGVTRPASSAAPLRAHELFASVQHLRALRFKDGRQEAVGHLALLMTRELGGPFYGSAQAGSAALGSAGAYSFGLFGLGAQTRLPAAASRVGAELLVGAAGGGGVAVQGGAVAQAELWARWDFGAQHRWRVRAGLGQWQALRGERQSSALFNLALGYAYGTVAR